MLLTSFQASAPPEGPADPVVVARLGTQWHMRGPADVGEKRTLHFRYCGTSQGKNRAGQPSDFVAQKSPLTALFW